MGYRLRKNTRETIAEAGYGKFIRKQDLGKLLEEWKSQDADDFFHEQLENPKEFDIAVQNLLVGEFLEEILKKHSQARGTVGADQWLQKLKAVNGDLYRLLVNIIDASAKINRQ